MVNHLEKENVNGPVGHARRDMKLEAVVIPVSDVDRAKAFYESLGWRLDADFRFDNGFRVVQFTPPGSDTSIQFGSQMTSAAPGSTRSGTRIAISCIRSNAFAARIATTSIT